MTYFNKPFNTEEQPIEKDRYSLYTLSNNSNIISYHNFIIL